MQFSLTYAVTPEEYTFIRVDGDRAHLNAMICVRSHTKNYYANEANLNGALFPRTIKPPHMKTSRRGLY